MRGVAGRIAETVLGGLLLSGALWFAQHFDAGTELIDSSVVVLGNIGATWSVAIWTTVGFLLALGVLAYSVSHWPPKAGIGADPAFSTIAHALGGFLASSGSVAALAAAGMAIAATGSWWSLGLLLTAVYVAARWIVRLVRRWYLVMNPVFR